LTETYFLSVQDGRVRLIDGTFEVLQRQDTLAVLRLRGHQLDLLDVIALPGAITGPPTSIAVNPRGTRAVVSAATRLDSGDPTRVVPGETVSLVALEQDAPPRVIATFTTGAGATGVTIHADGKLLLVANAVADSLSVMSIAEDRPRLKRVIHRPRRALARRDRREREQSFQDIAEFRRGARQAIPCRKRKTAPGWRCALRRLASRAGFCERRRDSAVANG